MIVTDSGSAEADPLARPFGERAPNVLLVADDGEGAHAARDAIALAGGRLVDRLAWDDAATMLGQHALIDLLLVEAEGVGADRIAAVLPRIDTLARATDAQVVVTLEPGQIDAVTAQLFGPAVQFLCRPDVTERVVALGLASGQALRLDDRVREAESERLRRLNEEVARIAETLARLTMRETVPATAERATIVGDRRSDYGGPPAPRDTPIDSHDIRKAIRSRRLREQFFAPSLLEDPGWDMLLDLFAADLEGTAVSVSSLCIAAAVAPTTALRWIGKMSEARLFQRRPDPFDRRRAFMALTEPAREAMARYCTAARQAGLAIA